MKRIYNIVILGFVSLFCAQAQVETADFFTAILTSSAYKPVNETQSAHQGLNTIFQQHQVVLYEQTLSSQRHPDRPMKVSIGCNCNRDTLIQELKDNNFISDGWYYELEPLLEPSDELYGEPESWHLPKIDADHAWDVTTGSSDMIIAIIYEGTYDLTHPDLENKFVLNRDPFLSIITHSAKGSSHGTNVASCAAAQTDGGGPLAATGFNTSLIGYMKLRGPVTAAYHATFHMGADVISLSQKGKTIIPKQRDIDDIKEILDHGTVIVRAAGNDQSYDDSQNYPFASAVDERIIIVSATDENDNHAHPSGFETFSNYPEVDLCAPGYDVPYAIPTLDASGNPRSKVYAVSGGTSLSAPMVAGICALMKDVNPCITTAEVQEALKSTTDPIADAHLFPGTVGTGRVNAMNAVLAAMEYGLVEDTQSMYSGTQTIEAPSKLVSSGVVIPWSDITFKANGMIELAPGFEVTIGAEFETIMETDHCN